MHYSQPDYIMARDFERSASNGLGTTIPTIGPSSRRFDAGGSDG
jgi:hypothetical protein